MRQQEYFMVNWLLKKLAQPCKRKPFHMQVGLGKDLPELKVKSKEIEKGINLFDFSTSKK